MNSAVNELTRSVVDKNSIHECSVNELEELTRQYPYFGPAQFLLAEKLKQENSPKYEQQSQKAILFFQDHLWFDYLSRKDDVTATISSVTHHEPVAAPVAYKPIEPEQKQHQPEQPQQIVTEEIEIIKEIEEPEPPGPEPKEEIVEEEPVTGEMHIEADPEPEPAPDSNEPPIKLPEFKIEPVDLSKPLSFEPYHAVDYFASQGIIARDEGQPKDRFSKQLRSFTDWLKAMKKLPETEIAAPVAAPEDHRVTQMAEHSIQDSQVVTETMAEVWEQQGNHEKAIETYRKLSLLDPAKSAYFAAKIEQLKHQ
jgi:hypothetical protein